LQAQAASLAAATRHRLMTMMRSCLISSRMRCHRVQLLPLVVVQSVHPRQAALLLLLPLLLLLVVLLELKVQQAMQQQQQQQEGLLCLQLGAAGGSSRLGYRPRCGAICPAQACSCAF
jgi:hypothetical protein